MMLLQSNQFCVFLVLGRPMPLPRYGGPYAVAERNDDMGDRAIPTLPGEVETFHESCEWNPRIFPQCSLSMMTPTYAHRYAAF